LKRFGEQARGDTGKAGRYVRGTKASTGISSGFNAGFIARTSRTVSARSST